jgi:predicted transcriptional regulator
MSIKEFQSILNAEHIGPEELMKCTLGIKQIEITAYCLLVNQGLLSINEAAKFLDRSRSTAQRILQNLVEKGLATREEELIGLGGYRYVYRAVNPDRIRQSILQNLDKWYKRIMEEIDNFSEKIEKMGCPKVD